MISTDLIYWSLNKMTDILQTRFSYVLSWLAMFEFRFRIPRSLFVATRFTINSIGSGHGFTVNTARTNVQQVLWHCIIFQPQFKNFKARHAPVFTLWNKLVKGEINHILTVDSIVWINSRLQPGPSGDCVVTILLFGNVPSWYSSPCHDVNFIASPLFANCG